MNAKGVEQVHGTGSYCTRVMVRFISKDAQAAALDVAFRSSYNFSFFVFHLRPCWMMMPSVVCGLSPDRVGLCRGTTKLPPRFYSLAGAESNYGRCCSPSGSARA